MKSSICIFLCLCTFSTCLSETINVDEPYSSGKVIVKRYQFNTIDFSNGLKIHFPIKKNGTAESSERIIGIAFNNFENAGYKYLQSAKPETVLSYGTDGMPDSIFYYSNTDTVWINPTVFPDSLIPLDNISETDEGTLKDTIRKGRYFLKTYTTINFPAHTEETPFDNYNILIYVVTIKNKMKLQISRMFMNSYPKATPVNDYNLDSMEIRWAVDSLGNGKFVELLSGIKLRTFQKKEYPTKWTEYRSNSIKNQIGEFSFYDINGRKLHKINNNNIVNGLIIFKQDYKYGKILIRKLENWNIKK